MLMPGSAQETNLAFKEFNTGVPEIAAKFGDTTTIKIFPLFDQITEAEDDGKMLSCEAQIRDEEMKPVSTMIEISVLCK